MTSAMDLAGHKSSFFTPMGAEMFYRYQQSLIDEATNTLGSLLQHKSDIRGQAKLS